MRNPSKAVAAVGPIARLPAMPSNAQTASQRDEPWNLSVQTGLTHISNVCREFTAKIVSKTALTEQRRLLGTTLASLRAQCTDGQHTASLGARWSFHRNGQRACQLAPDRRDGAPGFSMTYRAASFGCSAQWVIR